MNQALVEHAQHDVDRHERGGEQQRHVGKDVKTCAVPWKLP